MLCKYSSVLMPLPFFHFFTYICHLKSQKKKPFLASTRVYNGIIAAVEIE